VAVEQERLKVEVAVHPVMQLPIVEIEVQYSADVLLLLQSRSVDEVVEGMVIVGKMIRSDSVFEQSASIAEPRRSSPLIVSSNNWTSSSGTLEPLPTG